MTIDGPIEAAGRDTESGHPRALSIDDDRRLHWKLRVPDRPGERVRGPPSVTLDGFIEARGLRCGHDQALLSVDDDRPTPLKLVVEALDRVTALLSVDDDRRLH